MASHFQVCMSLLRITIVCSAIFAIDILWVKIMLVIRAAGVTIHIIRIKPKNKSKINYYKISIKKEMKFISFQMYYYFFLFENNSIPTRINKYTAGTKNTRTIYIELPVVIAIPGNINNANNGNAITMAVPLPKTISSATGDEKS